MYYTFVFRRNPKELRNITLDEIDIDLVRGRKIDVAFNGHLKINGNYLLNEIANEIGIAGYCFKPKNGNKFDVRRENIIEDKIKRDENFRGVEFTGSVYKAAIYLGKRKVNLGIYSTKIEAAAAFNYGIDFYHRSPQIKNTLPGDCPIPPLVVALLAAKS